MDYILAIDGSNTYVEILKKTTKKSPYHIQIHDPAIGLPKMSQDWKLYSMIMLSHDLSLEHDTGLDWLAILTGYPSIPPIILITDTPDKSIATRALKIGAVNCISKTTINTDPNNIVKKIKQSIVLATPSRKSPKGYVTGIFDISPSIHASRHKLEKTLADKKHEALQKKYTTLDIPGYKLVSEIADGGMSKIFRATRLEGGTTVVLKVLFTTDYQEPHALKRFMQEYSMIGTINHENIVHIYERGFATDFAYIAFEYLSHGSLTRRIRKGLSCDLCIDYLKQIAHGLIAIHEKNIIHRDLKPANILFHNEKKLKIIDFGVAIKTTSTSEIDDPCLIIGTPRYMSPEQCFGFPVDPRSDIYSLGIIFYGMLTGKNAFRAKKFQDFLHAHKKNIMPKLPPKFKEYQPLLDGMVAKIPEERFQTIDDLLAGIKWVENKTQ